MNVKMDDASSTRQYGADDFVHVIASTPQQGFSGYDCAAGILQSGACKSHPLCPVGVNQPPDGYAEKVEFRLPFEAACLWDIPLTIFSNSSGDLINLIDDVHQTSVGAMIAASHVNMHSCLSFAVRKVSGVILSHDMVTLSGAVSLINRLRPQVRSGGMVFARFSAIIGGKRIIHVLPLRTTSRGRYFCPDVVSEGACASDIPMRDCTCRDMELLIYDGLPTACEESEQATVTCGVSVARGGCCPGLPNGSHYCHQCLLVVNTEGHAERCQKVTVTQDDELRKVVFRRAQLGDGYHKQDVLMAVMALKVPDKSRTHKVSLYVSGEAQADYMRSLGHVGETKVLSTWFECMYPELRMTYLRYQFPGVMGRVYGTVPEFEDINLDEGQLVFCGRCDKVPDCWRGAYQDVMLDSDMAGVIPGLVTVYQGQSWEKWYSDKAELQLKYERAVDRNDVVSVKLLKTRIRLHEKVARKLTNSGLWLTRD